MNADGVSERLRNARGDNLRPQAHNLLENCGMQRNLIVCLSTHCRIYRPERVTSIQRERKKLRTAIWWTEQQKFPTLPLCEVHQIRSIAKWVYLHRLRMALASILLASWHLLCRVSLDHHSLPLPQLEVGIVASEPHRGPELLLLQAIIVRSRLT